MAAGRRLRAALLLVSLAACAPRMAPAPVVVTPSFPDFLFPVVPPGLGTPDAVNRHQRGWQFLQAGDPATAEREFSAALAGGRSFYPAEAGLGYAGLARREFKGALTHFDRALKVSPDYAPALVGKGEALLGLSRPDEAAAAFEAALQADPDLGAVRSRLQVLSLRSLQRNLEAARRAADAGRFDEARTAYQRAIAASPESAFLYRDLAAVERKQGDAEAALGHLRKAADLDPGDARTHVQIGELLEARQDLDAAAAAYEDAMALEPAEATAARLAAVRERLALARLPAEYREIPGKLQVTRGELAALVGVEFGALLQASARRDAVVITDLAGTWAAPWIQSAVRAGVMDVFANHTFQPRATVRRGDLAQAVSRLLGIIASGRAEVPRPAPPGPKFSDLPPGHLGYPAAAAAVAAGILLPDAGGAFQPSRPVTGAEAIEAMTRLREAARKSTPRGRLEAAP